MKTLFDASLPISSQNISVSRQVLKQQDRLASCEVLSIGHKATIKSPKSLHKQLKVYQRYLILQLFVTSSSTFSLELVIRDQNQMQRKLQFGNCSEIIKHGQNARIPQAFIPKNKWCNLCIDLQGLVSMCWKVGFSYLEGFSISGNCKLIRIYGLNSSFEWNQIQSIESPHVSKFLSPNTLGMHSQSFSMPVPKKLFGIQKSYRSNLGRILSKNNTEEVKSFRNQDSGSFPNLYNGKQGYQRQTFFRNCYDSYWDSISSIRHQTPPLVNTSQGLTYDPVRRHYLKSNFNTLKR